MKLKNHFPVLRKISLFKSFTNEEFYILFDKINYKITKYSKDSLVFLENEPCNTLNIILDGHLQIEKTDDKGNILVVTDFKTGDLVGETLIFGEPNLYPMTTISTSEVTMLYIHKDAVLYLCQQSNEFLVEFLKLISGKAITLSRKLDQISLKTIRESIIEYILMEYSKNKSMIIPLNMTKKKWAESLGVQRPSLQRELLRLKEEGLIDYDFKYIFIKDLEGLKNI